MNCEEIIHYRDRQQNRHRFNIIGFSNSDPVKYKHCIFCPGKRLQPDPHDDSKLMCFSCGYSILVEEAPNEEGISIKHNNKQTAIISPKRKKKKYYDKQGNEINDEDLIRLIQQGAHVISYHEQGPQ
jgi:hypothetical protein